MSNVVFVLCGWLLEILVTAIQSRLLLSHVMPDIIIITITFLVLRTEAVGLLACALILGYLTGRHAIAPLGIHETALALCAVCLYYFAGRFAQRGVVFFAVTSGIATMAYHALLFVLLLLSGERAGFSSLSTSLLLPQGFLTLILAFPVYGLYRLLDRYFEASKQTGLL